MDTNIVLIVSLAIPVLLLMILRVNAAQVFLSLCLGAVLVQFVAPDAETILASASARPAKVPTSQHVVDLFLLLLPVVLTTVFMIKSVRGRARLAFNFLPAIGVGALATLLAVPLMSAGLTGAITHLELWHKLQALQTLIISATTLLALLFLWMQRPKAAEEKGRR